PTRSWPRSRARFPSTPGRCAGSSGGGSGSAWSRLFAASSPPTGRTPGRTTCTAPSAEASTGPAAASTRSSPPTGSGPAWPGGAAPARRYRTSLGLGPTVSVIEGARSLRWASLALELADEGAVARAEELLPEIALRAAPDVLEALRERALAPLEPETPRSRE